MTALNHFNFLNLVGFLVTAIICTGWNVDGGPQDDKQDENENNIEVFTTFATRFFGVLTPAAFTFALERGAFALQAVFAMVQMMPTYRDLPVVQQGVRGWYLLACICEVLWIAVLNRENEEGEGGREDRLTTSKAIFLSLFMAMVLGFFSLIVYMQAKIKLQEPVEEYWLLRFPFVFGCGWSLVKFLITLNAPFADMEEQAQEGSLPAEIVFAILSLLVIVAVSVIVIRFAKDISPEYCIPMILTFYLAGVAVHLFSEEMEDHFEEDEEGGTLTAFQIISISTASVIFLGTASHAYCFRSTIERDEYDVEKQSSYEGEKIKADNINDVEKQSSYEGEKIKADNSNDSLNSNENPKVTPFI